MTLVFWLRRIAMLKVAVFMTLCFAAATIAFSLLGCESKKPPRTIADIDFELENLPTIYITEKSEKQIVASSKHGLAFVDPDSGEIAWIAYTCKNPDCPAKGTGQGGRPPLFIWRDPTATVQPNGTVSFQRTPPNGESYESYIERLGGHAEATCPACLKTWNQNLEKEEQRKAQKRKYADWVERYIPPEADQRATELRAERAAILEARKNQKSAKRDSP